MRNAIRGIGWVSIAAIGILIITCLSCLWNFTHAYILAGGDNPLSMLEGQWPKWNGTALSVALASVGSDFLKIMGGFILFGAFANKTGWKRAGAVTVALVVIVPTLLWSARSATGMVALVFGDTIATRGNEKAAAQSLAARIDQGQARLHWLERQTSDVGNVRRANAKEAAELRAELKQNRIELRSSKGVGAADPGGQIFATVLGITMERATTMTVVLFIVMVEVVTTLGWAALAMARGSASAVASVTETMASQTNAASEALIPNKPMKTQSDPEQQKPAISKNSFVPARTAFERLRKDMTNSVVSHVNTTNAAEAPERRRGRPKNAHRQDGHMEAFVDLCKNQGEKPRRKLYVRFCKAEHIGPLTSGEFHYALKLLRLRHLPPKTVMRYFDGQHNGNSLAH